MKFVENVTRNIPCVFSSRYIYNIIALYFIVIESFLTRFDRASLLVVNYSSCYCIRQSYKFYDSTDTMKGIAPNCCELSGILDCSITKCSSPLGDGNSNDICR